MACFMKHCSTFCIILGWVVVLGLQRIPWCYGNESLDGRFSFSLSTFDPSGKLAQVERAIIASSLGTPIVAVIQPDRILMASPQILPSPLMEDDGTTRFSNVTPNIAIAHSGISADGRVLVAAAQQLAVEHAYTYDENIPVDLFLEELSLLYQEYTMTPGVRPFGAILLVAYVPSFPAFDEEGYDEETYSKPRLFRIDPSGSVVSFDDRNIAIINGQFASSRSELESALENMSQSSNATVADDRERLSRILQEAVSSKRNAAAAASSAAKRKENGDETTILLPSAIITASLTRRVGLEVDRFKIGAKVPSMTSSTKAD